ncbi:carbonic anhydrase [Campylobacter jejuni]|uniref:Carbonic anhydrase n=3 Tax=Campylobacter TaxID=194 RepID=A0A5T1SRU3_CAMJU|nr:carbonic anhydrase [Campylobacter jejuni]
MLINQSFEIDSCDDVELNIKRTSKLEYRISYDDEKEIKAIVFIIGGFGANVNISFLDFDREYIAKNFDVVAVHVFYHCFCQRRSDVEKYSTLADFTKDDLKLIEKVLRKYNIPCDQLANNTVVSHCEYLSEIMTELKMLNRLPYDFEERLSATFIPSRGEYQNFGIMAAIDHINALKDLVKRFPKLADLPKIYGGGSYGGYLSLLIAKIAPWYVDGVIDNSGSALPPLNYILGREMEHSYGDYYEDFPHNRIIFFLKTHWTRKENSPYFFNNENYFIRTLLNKDHLILQSQKNKNIIYVSYHSDKDPLTPANFKQQTMQILKILGYDVSLNLIDENKIDGKFIKNLDHGCGIPDKALFRKELPLMLEKLQKRKSFMQENSISYPCGNKVFIFKDVGDKFELVIKD